MSTSGTYTSPIPPRRRARRRCRPTGSTASSPARGPPRPISRFLAPPRGRADHAAMRLRVTWIDGSETDLWMESLRELDSFVGTHSQEGVLADLKPWSDGLRLLFKLTAAATR